MNKNKIIDNLKFSFKYTLIGYIYTYFTLLICIFLLATKDEIFDGNLYKFIWEIVAFMFVAGSLVLSVNPAHLLPKQKNIFPKAGFLMIFSGILLIFSNGFTRLALEDETKVKFYGYLIGSLTFMALLAFSFALSILLVQSVISIFTKRK